MQSHIIYSFIIRGKSVTIMALAMSVFLLAGCGRQKRDVFTQTIYAQDGRQEAGATGTELGTSPDPSDASGKTQNSKVNAESGGSRADPVKRQICVFVCGAVMNEGVYYLDEGSRVIDAVNAAGGYREDADRIYVNQAEYVYDAERVRIPTVGEAEEYRKQDGSAYGDEGQGSGRSAPQTANGLININTASRSELMQIPGIGESKADRIIAYRENHGRFGSVEEILNVSGIGDGIYEGLKDYITVE